MKFRSSLFAAALLAASSLAHSQAILRPQPAEQQLSVSWLKDGNVIGSGTSTIYTPGEGFSPYVFQSGTSIGYGTCTRVGQNIKLQSQTQFVGRSLIIKPVSRMSDDKLRVTISVTDTSLNGKLLAGTDECRSEVLDVKGLSESDISVDIRDEQTVEVPFKDSRYRLVLRLRAVTQSD